MLAEAAGLAMIAALSPTALLVAAVYLGSARPRYIASYYLAGAVVMTIITGLLVLWLLRTLGLSRPEEQVHRYGLRLGLGVLLLAAGLVLATRKPSRSDPARKGRGLVSRMVATPQPASAFVVGILVFAPGATFVAAIQIIATARANVRLTALALVIVTVINVMMVWLPIIWHLAAPQATERYLSAFNRWLRAHGRTIAAAGLILAGLLLTGNGIWGLVTT